MRLLPACAAKGGSWSSALRPQGIAHNERPSGLVRALDDAHHSPGRQGCLPPLRASQSLVYALAL